MRFCANYLNGNCSTLKGVVFCTSADTTPFPMFSWFNCSPRYYVKSYAIVGGRRTRPSIRPAPAPQVCSVPIVSPVHGSEFSWCQFLRLSASETAIASSSRPRTFVRDVLQDLLVKRRDKWLVVGTQSPRFTGSSKGFLLFVSGSCRNQVTNLFTSSIAFVSVISRALIGFVDRRTLRSFDIKWIDGFCNVLIRVVIL